jgi:hypothetical protein
MSRRVARSGETFEQALLRYHQVGVSWDDLAEWYWDLQGERDDFVDRLMVAEKKLERCRVVLRSVWRMLEWRGMKWWDGFLRRHNIDPGWLRETPRS